MIRRKVLALQNTRLRENIACLECLSELDQVRGDRSEEEATAWRPANLAAGPSRTSLDCGLRANLLAECVPRLTQLLEPHRERSVAEKHAMANWGLLGRLAGGGDLR